MERVLRDKKAIVLLVAPAFLIYLFSVVVPIGWSVVYLLFAGMPGIQI